jgi:hypothetical protein
LTKVIEGLGREEVERVDVETETEKVQKVDKQTEMEEKKENSEKEEKSEEEVEKEKKGDDGEESGVRVGVMEWRMERKEEKSR